MFIDREAGLSVCVFKKLVLWLSQIQPKSHKTQNQPNILIKGSSTNQCVCLISSSRAARGVKNLWATNFSGAKIAMHFWKVLCLTKG